MPSVCRTKHNRAKPLSESASALFSIADADSDSGFARFYIVCGEGPLGTPESPLIVCGSSDTLCECPNVEETRNGMPTTAWKKYVNFASKNLPPSVYSGTFWFSGIPVILLITPKRSMLIAAIPFLIEAYSSWIPLFSHACIISSGHREDCTSPMCALRRKNIQIRDCPIPPPMV